MPSLDELAALGQVLLIDVTLAGDNAIVVGLAVGGLAPAQRRAAILWGTIGATVLRILLSLVALRLLEVIGLTLAGGVLLLWVCWRMFRELRAPRHEAAQGGPPASLLGAMLRILIADLSMSLDNVLAVAGAAAEHAWVLIVGLAVSVVLTGLAAGWVARLIERRRWLAWIGLAIVLRVAVVMIWEGTHQVAHALR